MFICKWVGLIEPALIICHALGCCHREKRPQKGNNVEGERLGVGTLDQRGIRQVGHSYRHVGTQVKEQFMLRRDPWNGENGPSFLRYVVCEIYTLVIRREAAV